MLRGKVVGIGGIFFKAQDPAALSSWHQEKGPTICAPMNEDSSHFEKASHLYINSRVAHPDEMCRQLKAAGIVVTPDPKLYPNGRFASMEDPEGKDTVMGTSVTLPLYNNRYGRLPA